MHEWLVVVVDHVNITIIISICAKASACSPFSVCQPLVNLIVFISPLAFHPYQMVHKRSIPPKESTACSRL